MDGTSIMFGFGGVLVGLFAVVLFHNYSAFKLLYSFSFPAVISLFAALVATRLFGASTVYFYYLLALFASYFVTVCVLKALLASNISVNNRHKRR